MRFWRFSPLPPLLLVIAVAFGACHAAKGLLLTEHEEFALAQEYMNAHKWEKAREHFQRLSDRFPGSALASEAILGKAESYFLSKNYSEAQTEYQLFLEFYPAHEKADLALYRIGLCQSRNLRGPDRDQAPTAEALATFQKLLEAHPDSAYRDEVRQRLAEAQDRMKRHDLYVARFYLRRGVHIGAVLRFRRLLASYELTAEERREIQTSLSAAWDRFVERRLRYIRRDFELKRWFALAESVGIIRHYEPEFPFDEAVRYAYAEALFQLNRRQDARSEFEGLLEAFPGGPHVPQARGRVQEILAHPTATPGPPTEPQIEGDVAP